MLNKFIFKYLIKDKFKNMSLNLSEYIDSNECKYNDLYKKFFYTNQKISFNKYLIFIYLNIIELKNEKVLKINLASRSHNFDFISYEENIFVFYYYFNQNKIHFENRLEWLYLNGFKVKELILLNMYLNNFNNNIQEYINEDEKTILNYFDFKGLDYVK